MTDIYTKITDAIKTATKAAGIDVDAIHLEHPTDLSHGDFATNVAMATAKGLGKNPREVGETIAEEIKKLNNQNIADATVAGPGFINITLSDDFLKSVPSQVLKAGEMYGGNDLYKGYKTLFEYTDPNPLKIFHIGHFMSNAVGEANSRITEFHGAEVKRACYFGDTGVHIAKTMYALRSMKDSIDKKADLRTQVAMLGKAYAEGNTQYEDNPEAKKEIDKLNVSIYNKEDTEDYQLYLWARQTSLDYFETIYKKIDTHFDFYFPESDAAPKGKEIVEGHIADGVFVESDGAVIFKGEDHDKSLHTRVFINKFGVPTYEAKELALAKIKSETYPYDVSVVITASEIDQYFKVLKKAMSLVFPDLEKKTFHISHGILKLPDGKMSSRKGTIISAEDLIEKVTEEVLKKMEDREIDNKEEVAEKIAIGALKYTILRQASGKDVVFDFNTALSFEGDSGPYLQYAYVRANSILEKAKAVGIQPLLAGGSKTYGLEQMFYRFPDVIKRAGHEHAPQYIVTYLTELASGFNSFYAKEKVTDPDDNDAPYKLALVEATMQILKNGMHILAIPVVEKM